MMESLHNELKVFNSAVKTTTITPFFVETNPKVTAKLNLRYTTRFTFARVRLFANLKRVFPFRYKQSNVTTYRFPEIPTPVAGEMMIKGILEEQRIFSVPGYMTMLVELMRYATNNVQTSKSQLFDKT